MKISVGMWDALFGETLDVELRGSDGRLVRRKVTKKWLERAEQEGKARKLDPDPNQVRVHMLHVVHGYSLQVWTVGTDVDQKTVKTLRDENGDLYALTYFEQGKPRVVVLKKEIWEQRCDKLGRPAL